MIISTIATYLYKLVKLTKGRDKVVNTLCVSELTDGVLGVLIEIKGDETCFTKLLGNKSKLLDRRICGIMLLYKHVRGNYAARILESKILSYEVELERNPNNMRARNKLEVLRKIYENIMVYDDPVKPALYILVCGSTKSIEENYNSVIDMLAVLGCKPKRKCLSVSFLKNNSGNIIQSLSSIIGSSLSWMEYVRMLGKILDGVKTVPIGHDLVLGKLVGLPLWDNRGAQHTLIVGPTGRGKTTLAVLVALLATLLYDVKAVLVDPKGDVWRFLKGTRLAKHVVVEDGYSYHHLIVSNLFSDSFHGIMVLDLAYLSENEKYIQLETILDTIFDVLRNNSVSSVLVIDEFWRIKNSDVVRRLVREGRSSNISLVLSSQQPSDYSSEVWNNISNVIMFGSVDDVYIRDVSRYSGVVYEDLDVLRRLGVGEALLRYQQAQRAIPFKILPIPITVKSQSIPGATHWGRVLRYG
ncbi:ATP-binding protein [Pyrodictium delaneyi]|nr:ATP-binding protein [Pyrodictium delaneyi]